MCALNLNFNSTLTLTCKVSSIIVSGVAEWKYETAKIAGNMWEYNIWK